MRGDGCADGGGRGAVFEIAGCRRRGNRTFEFSEERQSAKQVMAARRMTASLLLSTSTDKKLPTRKGAVAHGEVR